MGTKASSRRWSFLALFLAIGTGGLFLSGHTIFNHYGQPTLGKDSLPRVMAIENHKSALAHWLGCGIKNAVLVSIDAHDDLKKIPDIYIDELKTHSAKGVPDTTEKDGYQDLSDKVTNGNVLYAAAKLGIFKEIYWIIPAPFWGTPNQEKQLISLLSYYNFLNKDIKTFKMAGDCFKGQVNGISLSLCGVEALPDISEPIVLSIDTDFFPVAADSYGEKLINSISRTYNALAAKNYRVQDAVLAYSVDGGHLNTYHRWLGDLLQDIFNNPKMMPSKNLPDRYKTLQQADLLFMMGRYEDLFEHLLPFVEAPNPDPAMLTYQAFALDAVGAEAHAYSYAEQACLADQKYCYGLCEIGEKLLSDHGLAEAERFFVRSYELHPRMAHGQFSLAQAMSKNARLDEAIHYFMEFRRANGPFPVDFYLGKTFLLKGDEASALRYFQNASAELLRNPPVLADLGDLNIIREAITFYRQKGFEKPANALQVALQMRDRYYSDRPAPMH